MIPSTRFDRILPELHATPGRIREHCRHPAKHLERLLTILVLLPALPFARASAQGQGTYMNVESPQVSPIALATVGTRKLLVVCNTPDDSIEIWDTNETILPLEARFLDRLRVGLEPVSVLVRGDRFWTANFLGD